MIQGLVNLSPSEAHASFADTLTDLHMEAGMPVLLPGCVKMETQGLGEVQVHHRSFKIR